MPTATQSARADLRRKLLAISRGNTSTQRVTSLGMHFIPAPNDTPVLVSIEINVPRLLALMGGRVTRSKRGVATVCRGAVRVELATPEAREICTAALSHDSSLSAPPSPRAP